MTPRYYNETYKLKQRITSLILIITNSIYTTRKIIIMSYMIFFCAVSKFSTSSL
ncbi:hypothetical protein CMALT430_110059 [Carnobacterium maltaromaticum]|nr:hypothetical protein CMALT430_110059 [Carnobacterium maltaromaticum]